MKPVAKWVDELGHIRSQIEKLRERESELKADLINEAEPNGVRAFDGALFHVSVSFSDRRTTDWRSVAQRLADVFDIPEDKVNQIVRMNTLVAEGFPSVRCTARV